MSTVWLVLTTYTTFQGHELEVSFNHTDVEVWSTEQRAKERANEILMTKKEANTYRLDDVDVEERQVNE